MVIKEHNVTIPIPSGSNFSAREMIINRTVADFQTRIQEVGGVYIEHRINSKADTKVNITFVYKSF